MRNKQQVTLEGYGVRMRLVTVADAAFILALRHMPHALGKLGDLDISIEQEEQWLSKNIEDPHDYFFIIESRSGLQLGTLGVYNIDFDAKTAEVGRVVTIPGASAYLAARILLNDFSFDQLGLEKLIGHVVSTNKKVISFNKRIGSECKGVIKQCKVIDGHEVDMMYFELTRSQWTPKRKSLIEIAEKSISFIKS